MMSREKKLAVLRLLGQTSDPVSLFELLTKLPKDYAERTTRRWLNELVLEGLAKKSGQKRGTKYQVIKKNNIQSSQVSSSYFSSESVQILNQVGQPIYQRLPISYQDRWFDSYEPNKSFYLSKTLREQLSQAGIRCNRGDRAGTYAHLIFNRLLIDLSYNSLQT